MCFVAIFERSIFAQRTLPKFGYLISFSENLSFEILVPKRLRKCSLWTSPTFSRMPLVIERLYSRNSLNSSYLEYTHTPWSCAVLALFLRCFFLPKTDRTIIVTLSEPFLLLKYARNTYLFLLQLIALNWYEIGGRIIMLPHRCPRTNSIIAP